MTCLYWIRCLRRAIGLFLILYEVYMRVDYTKLLHTCVVSAVCMHVQARCIIKFGQV